MGMTGLRANFAGGAGTHRDSAEKEGWNWLRHCGHRPQPKEFQKASARMSPEESLREARKWRVVARA